MELRKKYILRRGDDEATAILAADALQPLAFQVLSEDQALSALPGITPPPRLRVQTLKRLLAYEMQARALAV